MATKETKKAETAKKEEPKKTATKVYHLSKRKEDGMWAITFVGGSKAVKLFKTKAEAEAYLETLAENQNASTLVHNSKGKNAGKIAKGTKASKK